MELMSSYTMKAISKKDGTEHDVWCMDDCFGKHKYGYLVFKTEDVLTEEQFNKQYTPKGG